MSKSKSMLGDARTELADLAKQKLQVEETLANLERQIYAFEGSYLEDTQLSGNVVRGWGNFLGSANRTPKRNNKKELKKKINEADRIFSKSSITSIVAVKGIGEVKVKAEINSETETAYSGSEDNIIANEHEKSNGQVTPKNPKVSVKRNSTTKKYKLKTKNRQTQ